MKLNKPKFWDKKIGIIAISIFPLSLVFWILIFINKIITKEKKFKIPIICIGNIYLGGTGKTPTSLFIAKELLSSGKRPAILRKNYKNHIDEYNLIKNSFKDLIVDQSRIDGLRKMENLNFDTAILDDGFQDHTIKKDFSIICFNKNQLIGNGLLLPAGPLRDSLSTLRNADVILINGDKDKDFEQRVLKINKHLEIFYSSYVPYNLKDFKNKKLLAIAGIGNPENFFSLLNKYNLNVEKKLVFPDHYNFSKKEIEDIIIEAEKKNFQIIMTEKDFFKIDHYKFKNIRYLKVSLKINEKEKLLKKINSLYD